MNFITVAGNLGKDAELRHLPDGTAVASFSVADSMGRDKPTIWWNCSMWGKRAEALVDFLRKGTQVTVVGQVSEREWQDRDGNDRKSMDVRVQDIKLQGGRQERADGDAAPRGETPTRQAPASSAPNAYEAAKNGTGGFDDMSDDIPF